MPRLVEYSETLEVMRRQGFRSLYYNSGAFGFEDMRGVGYVGWVGGEDPTLRPAMREVAYPVGEPVAERLAGLLVEAWQLYFPGVAWVMPLAHWAYELDFGSREWLPGVLEEVGLDARGMAELTTGNSTEFYQSETKRVEFVTKSLLEHLTMSDFSITFPGWPVTCTVHHHRQLWWTSNDLEVLRKLKEMAAGR